MSYWSRSCYNESMDIPAEIKKVRTRAAEVETELSLPRGFVVAGQDDAALTRV